MWDQKILRRAREQCGFSMEEIAGRLGITVASFSRMETGTTRVTTDRLEDLAKFYGLSASALLDGAIVTRPSTIDLERLREIVEAVERVRIRLQATPSPEKVGQAVMELYRLEIEFLVSNVFEPFDANRHIGVIEAMFRP
jgi:transcriptional regulator with XRE-family HTH domain